MSPMVVSACLAVLVAATVVSAATYTTKYDNVDIDQVLTNDRLRKNALNCLVDIKNNNCTPDVKELKTYIPDALRTGCSSCSDRHREGTQKVVRFLVKYHPDEFQKLAEVYDPEGLYLKRYKDEAAQAGINL